MLSRLILVVMCVLAAGCTLVPRKIVIHLPESVWATGAHTGAPGDVILGPGAAAFDRQLASHLGKVVGPESRPVGCPFGWVPLVYSIRFTALGCEAFAMAEDMPAHDGAVLLELAVDEYRVLGVIGSNFVDTLGQAERTADGLAAYYGRECRCTSFAEHGHDCDCGGHMVRVTGNLNRTNYQPVVMLYYYTDGEAFTDYWRAAMTWAEGARPGSTSGDRAAEPVATEPVSADPAAAPTRSALPTP